MLPFLVFIILFIMALFAQVSKVAHGPLVRVFGVQINFAEGAWKLIYDSFWKQKRWTVFLVFPSPFTLKKDNMCQCLQKGNVNAKTIFHLKNDTFFVICTYLIKLFFLLIWNCTDCVFSQTELTLLFCQSAYCFWKEMSQCAVILILFSNLW